MADRQDSWPRRKIREFRAWIRTPRAWIAIAITVALSYLGRYLATHDILTELAGLTVYLDRSLGSISTFGLAETFYRNLTGCAVSWAEGFDMSCRRPVADNGMELPSHILLWPLWLLNPIWVTVKSIWVDGTVVSIVIFLPSLLIGGIASAASPGSSSSSDGCSSGSRTSWALPAR